VVAYDKKYYSIIIRKVYVTINGIYINIYIYIYIIWTLLTENYQTTEKVKAPVCKVRGLMLLLQLRTLWRCGDGLLFEVPAFESDALLTMLHPLIENVLQTVDHFEISCLGAPFSWLEKPRNRMGARSELNSVFGLEKVYRWNPIRIFTIQSRSRPMRYLGFSNHEKGAPR
jgi:hypothetical protein